MKEFIGKLLQSLFPFDGNIFTVVCVAILFVIFFFFAVCLCFKLRKVNKATNIDTADDKEIENNKILKSNWLNYKKTFFNFKDESKTDDNAYKYFNEKTLLTNTNFKLFSAIPSILVGLGILGTFIGLTYGISNFETSSTEKIKESIQTLLAGMSTAFVSSIWGMLFSILYTFWEKYQSHNLRVGLIKFCNSLDNQYLLTKKEQREIYLEKQRGLFKEAFYYQDENENSIKPGNVLRDLFNESQAQTKALKSFADDLAQKIEAGFDRILNDPNKSVLKSLDELKNEIIKLGEKLQDPATDMIGKMIEDLKQALTEMVKEFNETISSSTKNEMETLSEKMTNAGDALNDFPIKIEEMTNNLNNNFEGLQKIVQQISAQTLQQSNNSTEKMKVQIEEMSEILKTNIGELQIGQEMLLNKQSENLKATENLLGSFGSNINQLNGVTSTIGDALNSFKAVQNDLKQATTDLNQISQNVQETSSTFKEAQTNFAKQSNEFLTKNESTIIEIQGSLVEAKNLYQTYIDNFSKIENGLSNIFEQVDKGLENYRDTIAESIGTFLNEYSTSLTETAKSLSGASEQQKDILNELTEQLSKFQSKQ